MANVPTEQIPGVYHRKIGDIIVTAVSDGFLDGALSVLHNITPEQGQALINENFGPAEGRRTSVNTFLIRSQGRCAIVDTGSGSYMGATAGWQLKLLQAAGVKPSDIDTIMLTHMHPDHSAGLSDRETWKPFYENAELVCHENELPHWEDDAIMARGTEREQRMYFQCTREQVAPYKKDRMRTFSKETEIFPGVVAMPASGHTPGHTIYQIQSGNEQLLIWGDTVHVPEIQAPHPEVCIDFDTDKDKAAASRRRVFDMVASDRLLVAGMHLHFPAFNHLVRRGSGFHLVPETWKFQM
jgi:glyoxylase-like metal-dependent hydrolase (beta-lactamase superfamily II)